MRSGTDTLIAVDVPAAGPPPDAPPQSPPSPRPVPPFPEIPTPPAGSQLQVSLAAEPEQALEGQAITFRATPRGLNNENVTSYEWDFDGDGTIDETSADGTRAHVYPTHGVKSPKVTIRTTAQHLATGTCSVTIGTAPASLSVILASNPASAPAGSAIAFNAIVSINAAAGTVTHYTWDWDTGSGRAPHGDDHGNRITCLSDCRPADRARDGDVQHGIDRHGHVQRGRDAGADNGHDHPGRDAAVDAAGSADCVCRHRRHHRIPRRSARL